MSAESADIHQGTLLRVDNVTVSRERQPVLRSVSFACVAGSVIALCGENGAGRTTLAEAIAGFLPIDTGTIAVATQYIHQMPTHRRVRAGCRLVRDRGNLFPNMSVRENLALFGAEPDRDGQVYTRILPKFPKLLDQKSGQLSGGEKRIIAILSAIIAAPRVLIVDEFTEGLYPEAVLALGAEIADFVKRGNAALLMVHSVSDIKEFNFIKAKISNGVIEASTNSLRY